MKRKWAATLVMTTVATMGAATPALASVAYDWATLSVPLKVYSGSTHQGSGYGTHNVAPTTDGLKTIMRTRLVDVRPGGEGIYGDMWHQSNSGYCFAPEYVSCDVSWYDYKRLETPRYYQSSWSGAYQKDAAVNPNGDYARGRQKICEDQSWSPDSCTGYGYSTRGHAY
jgi:hypothetical protein